MGYLSFQRLQIELNRLQSRLCSESLFGNNKSISGVKICGLRLSAVSDCSTRFTPMKVRTSRSREPDEAFYIHEIEKQQRIRGVGGTGQERL